MGGTDTTVNMCVYVKASECTCVCYGVWLCDLPRQCTPAQAHPRQSHLRAAFALHIAALVVLDQLLSRLASHMVSATIDRNKALKRSHSAHTRLENTYSLCGQHLKISKK